MITLKGHQDEVMLSLFKKEATYDAAVAVSAANFCSMKNFVIPDDVDWADDVKKIMDKEFSTDVEIIEQAIKVTYTEKDAKPNTLIGLAALAFGSITSTQDGALAAYRHKIVPVAVGTALPSVNLIHKRGGVQDLYKGLKCNTLNITGKEGGVVAVKAELLGSGTRATNADSFVASISESWLLMKNCKVWMEDGTSIAIDAVLTQHTENISSGTPDVIGPRLVSFDFTWNNNLEEQRGSGGGGSAQDIDCVRRQAELKFSLLFKDITERNYFVNKTPLAIEFDLKGALIAVTGTMYYGFQLIVPRFKLMAAPMPKGSADDFLTQDFNCDVQDDGTNAIAIVEGYNAKAGYLLA